MSRYLVLPRLDVQRANALAAGGIVSLTPVMAATLMGTAFAERFGISVSGVMVIHHDARLCGQKGLNPKQPHSPNYHLELLKGATLFDRDDLAGKPSGNSLGVGNASQPNVFMNGVWSVVFRIPDSVSSPDAKIQKKARTFLEDGARLAGGDIIHYGSPIVLDVLPGRSSDQPDAVTDFDRVVRGGFVLFDETPLLADRSIGQDRIERLMHLTWKKAEKKSGDADESASNDSDLPNNGFRSPAILGYGLISPLSENSGAREGVLHACCEPLIGVAKLKSIRQLKEDQTDFDELFWEASWPSNDVFLLTQPAIVHYEVSV